MKALLVMLILGGAVLAQAKQTLYIKSGNEFRPATKKEATLALLGKKGEVFKCTAQELTDTLSMRTVSKDE